jgi:predicted GNAT family acetyltransferase
MVVTEQLHLLLGGAHEEEATCVQQEGREVLEAVDIVVILAIRGDVECGLVTKDEADLDDSGQASSHERVAEDGVNVCAEI